MAKTATDTGNTITEGYVIKMVGIEEYFETQSGALSWAKAGNIPPVEFYTDEGVSDADKLDDLMYGNLMEHSVDI